MWKYFVEVKRSLLQMMQRNWRGCVRQTFIRNQVDKLKTRWLLKILLVDLCWGRFQQPTVPVDMCHHLQLQSPKFIAAFTQETIRKWFSIHAENYLKLSLFSTVVVNPDGSTYMIRYHEPRAIITLPFDLSQLTESERKARLEKRKPRREVKIEAEVDDKFNANKYLKYMKKKWANHCRLIIKLNI